MLQTQPHHVHMMPQPDGQGHLSVARNSLSQVTVHETCYNHQSGRVDDHAAPILLGRRSFEAVGRSLTRVNSAARAVHGKGKCFKPGEKREAQAAGIEDIATLVMLAR